GIPGVIGMIDGYHIQIMQPHNNSVNFLIPATYHLIRNSAYSLSQFLMISFKNNGHLSREHI
ncbi:hypothetical protein ALC53_06545, partial [Atta colombica]